MIFKISSYAAALGADQYEDDAEPALAVEDTAAGSKLPVSRLLKV